MISLLHPLDTVAEVPRQMNNPFYYEPDALCRQAMERLSAYLRGDASQCFLPQAIPVEFQSEIAKGKMFGVLVVETPVDHSLTPNETDSLGSAKAVQSSEKLSFLAGYSGQICGRSDWEGFAPAVFDYLAKDGYFKQKEREIEAISEILPTSLSLTLPDREGRESLLDAPPTGGDGGGCFFARPVFNKARGEGESSEDYIKRRQFENAELHRWKLKQRALKEQEETVKRSREEHIKSLRTLRRQKSDELQTWLFRHFVMRNAKGESKDLVDIFAQEDKIPPAGSGECCEPKLLQYALTHGLKPVSMAMFWWGESPRQEVRHHLQTYPACNGKCKPILRWMLRGMDVMPNPLEQQSRHELRIVYDDASICVVDKPAGMLAVPGKNGIESVLSQLQLRFPDAEGPMIVHRLDMATSGLMVVAKTTIAYKVLQDRFARHEIKKRYVAELSQDLTSKQGKIILPLRPDLVDRPRQVVDEEFGKPAATYYQQLAGHLVALYPFTGRTHQLRVHCAHHLGLDNPIRGDELYGERADRLYLHAERLTLRHPDTGEEMTFTAPVPF